MSREALARLSARTVNYDSLSRAKLRSDNMATLLSGCSPGAVALAMMLDLGMEGGRRDLYAAAMLDLIDRRNIQQWMRRKPRWLEKLVLLGIAEIRRVGTCATCAGRKQTVVGEKTVICGMCHGYGRVKMSDRERAKLLEIPESTYRYALKKYYREVWGWFAARDAEIGIKCWQNSRA